MTTDSAYTSRFPILLALCSLAVACTLVAKYFSLPLGATGTVDFVQYWASWRAMLHGEDCYNGHVIYEIQSRLTSAPPPALLSWNPPWTFVLLSPLLALSFEQSAALWMFVEILLLCFIVSVVPHTFKLPPLRPLTGALVAATFFPVINSMYWGQLGILLAASVASFMYFQRKEMPFWAGISLLPLTTKPHLFLLFIPPGIAWVMQSRRKERFRFLLGSIGGFSILAAITLAVAPTSISSWVHHYSPDAIEEAGAHSFHFKYWKTATLATWIRIAISSFTQQLPIWPLVAFPLVGLLASAVYFLRYRTTIAWTTVTPSLLCLSLLMSSYGWAYDQSILLICQIVVICRTRYYSSYYARLGMLIAAFSVQVLALLFSSYFDAPQHYYAWIPLAILSLLAADKRMQKGSIEALN